MQNFFLTTLGYKSNNDQPIKQTTSVPKDLLSVPKDKRGKHNGHASADTKLIEEHIESFNPCIPHYRREHAPFRRYLTSDLNILKMHRDYLEKYPDNPVGRETYRKVVKKCNISFTMLGNEECEICTSASFHKKETSHDLIEDCVICKNFNSHKTEYT